MKLDKVSNDTIIVLMDFIEKEYQVKLFIKTLIDILNNAECTFILKRDRASERNKPDKFTNRQTLADLSYDDEDVKHELISLKAENYVESLEDKNPYFNDEPFRVFVKKIEFKESVTKKSTMDVYIKVKIKSIENKIVVCVSFHRAQFDFNFPYN